MRGATTCHVGTVEALEELGRATAAVLVETATSRPTSSEVP
jgi:hypothetical protein